MANLRVKKKHLDANSVDGTKIKLSANEALRGVDKDSAEVDLLKLDGNNKLIGYGYELARKVDLEAEESARVAADLTEKSERIAADDAEESARVAADLTEKSERIAADSSLQAAIDAEASSRQVAIASLVDSAPEVLDTLNELAAALGDDANFATTVANRLSEIEGSLSASATNLEDYTDQKVQELKDLISDTLLRKESFVLTSQQVTNGYVVLSGTSVIDKSVSAFKDRLSVFEGEDFTVSVVNGETRLTFINSYASGGEEAVEAGDELRVTYWSFA